MASQQIKRTNHFNNYEHPFDTAQKSQAVERYEQDWVAGMATFSVKRTLPFDHTQRIEVV